MRVVWGGKHANLQLSCTDRLLVAVLIPLALRPSGAARDILRPGASSACTRESVAGVFNFNQELLKAASTGAPAAVVGILDLRPDGSFALQFRAFLERGGEPVTSIIYRGEWTVDENCFGFADFEATESTLGPVVDIDFQFIAVENASELFLIRNNPLEEADAKLLFRR